MVLQGIANENEFYSAHYLSAILAGDLKTFAKQKADQMGRREGGKGRGG